MCKNESEHIECIISLIDKNKKYPKNLLNSFPFPLYLTINSLY